MSDVAAAAALAAVLPVQQAVHVYDLAGWWRESGFEEAEGELDVFVARHGNVFGLHNGLVYMLEEGVAPGFVAHHTGSDDSASALSAQLHHDHPCLHQDQHDTQAAVVADPQHVEQHLNCSRSMLTESTLDGGCEGLSQMMLRESHFVFPQWDRTNTSEADDTDAAPAPTTATPPSFAAATGAYGSSAVGAQASIPASISSSGGVACGMGVEGARTTAVRAADRGNGKLLELSSLRQDLLENAAALQRAHTPRMAANTPGAGREERTSASAPAAAATGKTTAATHAHLPAGARELDDPEEGLWDGRPPTTTATTSTASTTVDTPAAASTCDSQPGASDAAATAHTQQVFLSPGRQYSSSVSVCDGGHTSTAAAAVVSHNAVVDAMFSATHEFLTAMQPQGGPASGASPKGVQNSASRASSAAAGVDFTTRSTVQLRPSVSASALREPHLEHLPLHTSSAPSGPGRLGSAAELPQAGSMSTPMSTTSVRRGCLLGRAAPAEHALASTTSSSLPIRLRSRSPSLATHPTSAYGPTTPSTSHPPRRRRSPSVTFVHRGGTARIGSEEGRGASCRAARSRTASLGATLSPAAAAAGRHSGDACKRDASRPGSVASGSVECDRQRIEAILEARRQQQGFDAGSRMPHTAPTGHRGVSRGSHSRSPSGGASRRASHDRNHHVCDSAFLQSQQELPPGTPLHAGRAHSTGRGDAAHGVSPLHLPSGGRGGDAGRGHGSTSGEAAFHPPARGTVQPRLHTESGSNGAPSGSGHGDGPGAVQRQSGCARRVASASAASTSSHASAAADAGKGGDCGIEDAEGARRTGNTWATARAGILTAMRSVEPRDAAAVCAIRAALDYAGDVGFASALQTVFGEGCRTPVVVDTSAHRREMEPSSGTDGGKKDGGAMRGVDRRSDADDSNINIGRCVAAWDASPSRRGSWILTADGLNNPRMPAKTGGPKESVGPPREEGDTQVMKPPGIRTQRTENDSQNAAARAETQLRDWVSEGVPSTHMESGNEPWINIPYRARTGNAHGGILARVREGAWAGAAAVPCASTVAAGSLDDVIAPCGGGGAFATAAEALPWVGVELRHACVRPTHYTLACTVHRKHTACTPPPPPTSWAIEGLRAPQRGTSDGGFHWESLATHVHSAAFADAVAPAGRGAPTPAVVRSFILPPSDGTYVAFRVFAPPRDDGKPQQLGLCGLEVYGDVLVGVAQP